MPRNLLFLLFAFLPLLLLKSNIVQAQIKQYSGKLVDAKDQQPVAYASIGIVGTNKGTVSDENGNFQLVIAPIEGATIALSSIGYQTKKLPLSALHGTIELTPSVVQLNPVIVRSKAISAEEIVATAFKSIKRNYFHKPIVFTSFYQHYCSDSARYGRVIEASVDLYKNKGYGKRETYKNSKDRFKIKELRRSFDYSQQYFAGHVPISLQLVSNSDIAANRQVRGERFKEIKLMMNHENFLSANKKDFEFEIEKITTFNGQEVYVIAFKNKTGTALNYRGKLYINVTDDAILQYEGQYHSGPRTFDQVVKYKKYGKYYALFHSHSEQLQGNSKNGHLAVIDFTVNDLIQKKDKTIKKQKINREYLSTIPYHPEFWSNYAAVRKKPLPDNLKKDLNERQLLDSQYVAMSLLEARFNEDVKKQNKKFIEVLKESTGIKVVDVWASWCEPCIVNFSKSKQIRKQYESEGVQFLLVSIDKNKTQWRKISTALQLPIKHSYLLGTDASFLSEHKVKSIPRYLVFHNGVLIDDNAPSPETDAFARLIKSIQQ